MVATLSHYKLQFTVGEILDICRYTKRDAEQLQIISTAPPTVRRIRDKLRTLHLTKL
jgi:hypothetical protein